MQGVLVPRATAGSNPVLGKDYQETARTEDRELKAENRLRAAPGLP
jgi:hypothetical protein